MIMEQMLCPLCLMNWYNVKTIQPYLLGGEQGGTQDLQVKGMRLEKEIKQS